MGDAEFTGYSFQAPSLFVVPKYRQTLRVTERDARYLKNKERATQLAASGVEQKWMSVKRHLR
jgi:hypothetical protein